MTKVIGGVLRRCALAATLIAPAALADPGANDDATVTPIRHVIVIIGQSRGFDHVFGAYVPKPGQSILNILSQGIITANTKDFPAAALEPLGLEAVRPDDFLLDQLDLSPPKIRKSSASKPPAPEGRHSPRETWRPSSAGQAYPASPTRSSASWPAPWTAPDRQGCPAGLAVADASEGLVCVEPAATTGSPCHQEKQQTVAAARAGPEALLPHRE